MKLARWFISWLRFEKCSHRNCRRANNHYGSHDTFYQNWRH